jgi:hypothetical protein
MSTSVTGPAVLTVLTSSSTVVGSRSLLEALRNVQPHAEAGHRGADRGLDYGDEPTKFHSASTILFPYAGDGAYTGPSMQMRFMLRQATSWLRVRALGSANWYRSHAANVAL